MLLALYGAGAMGREFKYIADASGEWEGVVFIDDHAASDEIMGCPVMGFQAFLKRYSPEEIRFIISIGEPRFRRESFEKMKKAGYTGGVLREPLAYVSPDAEIGEGTALCRNSYIGSLARVGKNAYISVNASVGHDAVIGDHTRLGVHAFVGGHAVIGENCFIGSGALIRDRVRVGDGSVLGLGAAVFADVPPKVTMIGNPARIADENDGRPVYEASIQQAPNEPTTPADIAETYWNAFTACFEGIDFNPATFRFHDKGWDSAAQMNLISHLEEAFGIAIKGREVLKLNTFRAGLNLVRKKLGEKE